MGQDYLIHMTLLCNECAYANRADIQKMIDKFA